ncbi:MAG: Clp protease N-terminal domain-containing protein [Acidimicrobiales bacterium]
MFERFTPRARRVIVSAQDAARGMGHRLIRPEHLVVALREEDGMAALAMEQCGVDASALRTKVADKFEVTPSAHKLQKIPFSPEAKKSLELSLRSALELRHNYIGTEHLFLGVHRGFEHRGESLDELVGVDTEEIQNKLRELMGSATSERGLSSSAVQSATDLARHKAKKSPMTTGHLLLAMIEDEDSQAAIALSSLGVSSDVLQSAVDRVPLAGTSDASLKPTNVVIRVGETTTIISDSDVAAALGDLSKEQLLDAIRRSVVFARGEDTT